MHLKTLVVALAQVGFLELCWGAGEQIWGTLTLSCVLSVYFVDLVYAAKYIVSKLVFLSITKLLFM